MLFRSALRRKLKPIKGAKVYMRVFPDVPVCIKVRVLRRYHDVLQLTTCVRVTKPVWVRERARLSSGRLGELHVTPSLTMHTHRLVPASPPDAFCSNWEVRPFAKSWREKVRSRLRPLHLRGLHLT